MKLTQLFEGVTNKRKLKAEADKAKVADKAADLADPLEAVKNAKTLEDMKEAAKKMADSFKVGGKDKFLAAVDKCKDTAAVLKLAYNAALKGEGNAVIK